MYDFGVRLRDLRRQRGLTQKELASKINKSIAAISSYETGAQVPPGDVLKSIAYALSSSADYLLDIDKSDSISLKNLTAEQRELIEMLFREFANPSGQGTDLSQQQVDIIQKVVLLLSKQRN